MLIYKEKPKFWYQIEGPWKVWIHQKFSLMFGNVQILRVAGGILIFQPF